MSTSKFKQKPKQKPRLILSPAVSGGHLKCIINSRLSNPAQPTETTSYTHFIAYQSLTSSRQLYHTGPSFVPANYYTLRWLYYLLSRAYPLIRIQIKLVQISSPVRLTAHHHRPIQNSPRPPLNNNKNKSVSHQLPSLLSNICIYNLSTCAIIYYTPPSHHVNTLFSPLSGWLTIGGRMSRAPGYIDSVHPLPHPSPCWWWWW